MNIFYTHPDPVLCAKQHNVVHNRKMIIEYAQILSTAHRVLDGTMEIVVGKNGRKKKVWNLEDPYMQDNLYAVTHMNHPSAIWARQSNQNYVWLYLVFLELANIFEKERGKPHKTAEKLRFVLSKVPENIPKVDFFEPPFAGPEKILEQYEGNIVQSYRELIRNKMVDWETRDKKIDTRFYFEPEWLNKEKV